MALEQYVLLEKVILPSNNILKTTLCFLLIHFHVFTLKSLIFWDLFL